MGELLQFVLIKTFLLCIIAVPESLSGSIAAISNDIDSSKSEAKVYVHSSDLVMREKSAESVIYHFITDYPHPHVPTNNYIKPWEVVASKPIRVKNIDGSHSRILKKNNILYLDKSHKSSEDNNT